MLLLLTNGKGDAEPERRLREDPGRGLGLGGALSSLIENENEVSTAWPNSSVPVTVRVAVRLGGRDAFWTLTRMLGILGRVLGLRPIDPPAPTPREEIDAEEYRGLRPLSSTFLRALALTQTSIWRRASRSETIRVFRWVELSAVMRGMVVWKCGMMGRVRIGVSKFAGAV